MSKSKVRSSFGRSLMKDRFGSGNRGKRTQDSSMLHTSEINDGYDWGRLNLQSVTEESSFQEFLSIAELAGTEFQCEKLNVSIVNPRTNVGLLSEEEQTLALEAQVKNKQLLRIPRRPTWDITTTPEELDLSERTSFLKWRHHLASLSEVQGLLLTPYEKNLEFWRQLWRVVEKSDVVVQIVDARNPLLFRCEDLERYVKEISKDKMNLLLLNKSDFLTDIQREVWASYFENLGVKVAFFSSILNVQKEVISNQEVCFFDGSIEQKDKPIEEDDTQIGLPTNETNPEDSNVNCISTSPSDDNEDLTTVIENEFIKVHINDQPSSTLPNNKFPSNMKFPSKVLNSSAVLSPEDLLTLFKSLHHGPKVTDAVTTIGLVGYPNVGKSSTINALMTEKKVSVSATPGKTKHFQTMFIDKDLLLCDCPGLVMPSFVSTKAEMITNGILPIDQIRDHVPPVTLVAKLIPRHVLEAHYGIMLPLPREEEDQSRQATSEELCNAYGYNRGFMTKHGLPDNPRSARYILKDFVCGKLLYCHAPPGTEQRRFHTFPEMTGVKSRLHNPVTSKILKSHKMAETELDKLFFKPSSSGFQCKGIKKPGFVERRLMTDSTLSLSEKKTLKPWKDHSNKRNKKQKLRCVYSHLDA